MTGAVWLLDVRLDGRVYRWASEPAEVVDLAGATWVYLHGLGDLTGAVGAVGAITVHDPDVDWATHGPLLDGSPATLRRWVPGTLLEDAEVYAAGEVVAEWSAPDAPVLLEIVRRPGTLGSPVPAATARVDATTWPTGAGVVGQVGATYPVILGYPGYTAEGTTYAVVPAPVAEWSTTSATVILADDPDVATTSVVIANDDRETEDTYTTTGASDLLGQGVRAVVLSSGDDAYPSTATSSLLAGYSPTGGGGPARAAYDVLRYLLTRWGGDSVDWARLGECQDVLEGLQVDTWIETPMADPWAWVEATLLADLPLVLRTSARGRYLAGRPWTVDPRRTVGALEVGVDVWRSTLYARAGAPVNEIVVDGRVDRDGWALARIVLTGDLQRVATGPTSAAQYVHVVSSPACALSVARYGVRPAEEPTLVDWTWDVGTLLRVAQHRADRDALPAILATYEVAGDVPWREGDQVELTDPDAAWVSRLAIVDEEPVRGTSTTITLRIPEAL